MVKRACRVLPAEVPCGKQSQKTPPALHRLQIIGKGRETLFDCTFSRRAAWNTRKQEPEIELKSLQNDAETAQSKHGIPGKNLDCQQRSNQASGESTVLLSLQGRLVTQSGSGLSPRTAADIQADMLPALPKDGAPLHFTISQGTSCSLMIPAARPMPYSAAAPAPSGKWRRHPVQPRICPAGSAPAAHGSQMPSARHSCASGVPQSTPRREGSRQRAPDVRLLHAIQQGFFPQAHCETALLWMRHTSVPLSYQPVRDLPAAPPRISCGETGPHAHQSAGADVGGAAGEPPDSRRMVMIFTHSHGFIWIAQL